MDRKSFLDASGHNSAGYIRGGHLDKLITFSSINNDNRGPITRMHDPFIRSPAPSSSSPSTAGVLLPDTFIFRESFRALYTAFYLIRNIYNVPLIELYIFFFLSFCFVLSFSFLFFFFFCFLFWRVRFLRTSIAGTISLACSVRSFGH